MKKNLRHGQALSMQWVNYVLGKIINDVNTGGVVTKQLLGDSQSVGGNNGLESLVLGCSYTTAFLLPLNIELALKALLYKETGKAEETHNLLNLFNVLSGQTKEELEKELINQQSISEITLDVELAEFMNIHKNDFVEWRYLDNIDNLSKHENEMQVVICTILEVYNQNKCKDY